jgi:hypothetical protein
MTTQKVTRLLVAGMLVVLCGLCLAQQRGSSSECSTAYENHNQIDYGALKVRLVDGTSIVEVGTQKQPGVPEACFVLFAENDHKLVATVKADSEGRFQHKDVAPGRYRLIARAGGLCAANIPLEVLSPAHRRKTEILVHFRPAGIDTCSYGELVRVSAKPTPKTH